MRALTLTIIFIFFSILSARAEYKGELSFSSEEVQNHLNSIDELVSTSRNCLLRYKREHEEFYKKTCIKTFFGKKKCLSKYYGERRYTKVKGTRRSDGKKLDYLPKELKKEGFNPELVNYMEATSCVGLALQCLKEGFSATNQAPQWDRVMNFVRANNVGGTSLQDALQKLGWKIYYWNPVPHQSILDIAAKWDKEERKWQSKGWHAYRYQKVMNEGTYWFNTVDNSNDLVGFEKQVPGKLYQFPFWVGTANTGYHVFPGTFEKVVEAHSTRHFTAYDNLELSDFNPLSEGGGPRWTNSEKYRSGLFALPPIE